MNPLPIWVHNLPQHLQPLLLIAFTIYPHIAGTLYHNHQLDTLQVSPLSICVGQWMSIGNSCGKHCYQKSTSSCHLYWGLYCLLILLCWPKTGFGDFQTMFIWSIKRYVLILYLSHLVFVLIWCHRSSRTQYQHGWIPWDWCRCCMDAIWPHWRGKTIRFVDLSQIIASKLNIDIQPQDGVSNLLQIYHQMLNRSNLILKLPLIPHSLRTLQLRRKEMSSLCCI